VGEEGVRTVLNTRPASVQLRCATLPTVLGALAVHHWLVVFEPSGRAHRWEVWQTRNAGGTCIGHVHRDLKHPDAGVGGGPYRVAAEWSGAQALAIQAVLGRISDYPWCERYRAWPGPNSNTFVAWVLEQAGIECALGWKAIGGRYGMRRRTR
jgi:hypothetical protein